MGGETKKQYGIAYSDSRAGWRVHEKVSPILLGKFVDGGFDSKKETIDLANKKNRAAGNDVKL